MTKFIIKAEQTVTYRYDVEADSIEEAIAMVEDEEADDCSEVDSSAPRAVEYAVEGQMGWNVVSKDAACDQCGNTLNDGSDICDQCGGRFV